MSEFAFIGCLFFTSFFGEALFVSQGDSEIQQEAESTDELDYRTWIDIDGRKADLAFLRKSGTTIYFVNRQKKEFQIPISRFTSSDQSLIRRLSARNKKREARTSLPAYEGNDVYDILLDLTAIRDSRFGRNDKFLSSADSMLELLKTGVDELNSMEDAIRSTSKSQLFDKLTIIQRYGSPDKITKQKIVTDDESDAGDVAGEHLIYEWLEFLVDDQGELSGILLSTGSIPPLPEQIASATRKPKESQRLVGHRGSVGFVAFSEDGNSVVSASSDGMIKRWQLGKKPKSKNVLQVESLAAVDYSPESDRILFKAINTYGTDTASGNAIVTTPISQPFSIGYLEDGDKYLVGCLGRVDLISADPNVKTEKLVCLEETSKHLHVFSLSSDRALSIDDSGVVRIWPLKTRVRRIMKSFQTTKSPIVCAACNRDGDRIAILDENNNCVLWNVATGQSEFEIKTTHPAKCMVFANNGESLLVAGGEKRKGLVSVIDINAKEVSHTVEAGESLVLAIGVAQDNSKLATGSVDKSIRLWKLSDFAR